MAKIRKTREMAPLDEKKNGNVGSEKGTLRSRGSTNHMQIAVEDGVAR